MLKPTHLGQLGYIGGLHDRVVLRYQFILTFLLKRALNAGQRTHHGECVQDCAQLEGCQGGAGVGGTAAVS